MATEQPTYSSSNSKAWHFAQPISVINILTQLTNVTENEITPNITWHCIRYVYSIIRCPCKQTHNQGVRLKNSSRTGTNEGERGEQFETSFNWQFRQFQNHQNQSSGSASEAGIIEPPRLVKLNSTARMEFCQCAMVQQFRFREPESVFKCSQGRSKRITTSPSKQHNLTK